MGYSLMAFTFMNIAVNIYVVVKEGWLDMKIGFYKTKMKIKRFWRKWFYTKNAKINP